MPRWSERIHDEWTSSLARDRPDITRERIDEIRDLMDKAFPDASVRGFDASIDSLDLPDSNDRHVLAAAIHANADVIVTLNIRDFPGAALQPHEIALRAPDAFAHELLEKDEQTVIRAVRAHRAALRRPPRSADEHVDAYGAIGLPTFAKALASFSRDI